MGLLNIDPVFSDRPPAADRYAQHRKMSQFLGGATIISADSHWEVTRDIFHQAFPEEIRDLAPRVWFDRYWRQGNPDEKPETEEDQAEDEQRASIIARSVGRGAWDMAVRQADMDAEGVHAEIVYPQSLLGFVRHPDRRVQQAIYDIYNRHLAQMQNQSGGRFFGVGICRNWWDPNAARSAVNQVVELGLKSLTIPTTALGAGPDGKELTLGSPYMHEFWSAVADAGLPVGFHIGEIIRLHGPGQMGSTTFQSLAPFRKPMGDLIFGGVLDRHPDLKIVFAEGGLAWVPAALQDADMVFDTHGCNLDIRPQLRPSEYWRRNFFATFQSDPIGLKMLDLIGTDRIMWGSDYPHNESTFGRGWDALEAILEIAGADATQDIVGGTAQKAYNL